MPQTPFFVSQVSTERIFTSWMPAALIALDVPLLDHRALRHDDLAVLVDEVLGRGAAEDARGQRRDDLAGVDDGAHA